MSEQCLEGKESVSLDLESLRGLAFAGKPEAFRILSHLSVHLASRLPQSSVTYRLDSQGGKSAIQVVVSDCRDRAWREEEHILRTRSVSLQTNRTRRLVIRLEIDAETDRLYHWRKEGDRTIWPPLGPESVQPLVEEAHLFWSQTDG